jgi:hypothetical protein
VLDLVGREFETAAEAWPAPHCAADLRAALGLAPPGGCAVPATESAPPAVWPSATDGDDDSLFHTATASPDGGC